MTVVATMIFRALPLDSWMPQEILAEEIEGDGAGDDHGARTADGVAVSMCHLQAGIDRPATSKARPMMYCPADIAADRAGQDVVEHQRGDGELGQKPAHRLLDHAVDAAADEQRAAFDVDRADGVAEEHHGQDEPGGGRPDGPFDDAADVVGGAGQVAQHDRRRPPVGDEREHHAADDDHLDGSSEALQGSFAGPGGMRGIRHGWDCAKMRERTVGVRPGVRRGGPFKSAKARALACLRG